MGTRAVAPMRIAFHLFDGVGARDDITFAAQWLACALPCRRFACALAGTDARFGAVAVGIEMRRACILGYGGYSHGFPWGLNPAPIMLTFPQAPLRSRAAGFPRLGSDLGISSVGLPIRQ